MRPRLSICHRACSDEAITLQLTSEMRHSGIEFTLDPRDVEDGAIAASRLGLMAQPTVPVRYHFPLCELELSNASHECASRAMSAMCDAVRAVAGTGGDFMTVHAALPSDSIGSPRFSSTAERLRDLVDHGRHLGVTVSLENLRWGATAEPDAFLHLVEHSGAAITLDVGHAVSSEPSAHGYSAKRFIAECGSRIRHAHVYDRETDRHHPPADLDRIGDALDALLDTGCDWWTIELTDADEFRMTRDILTAYLDAREAAAQASVRCPVASECA